MKDKEPMADQENVVVEAFKTIALSALLAFGIRTFVAEARFIPSGSMLPTLEVHDRLIIDKVSYRFEDPERGDIVVFNPTDELRRQQFKDAFIKRVIGLPGDRIEVRGCKVSDPDNEIFQDCQVYVNGKSIEENYIKEGPNYEWTPEDINLPERVPDNSYLVLGDNRNNSYDSHFWGYVPREKIIGRAVVRFWPPGRIGGVEEPTYPADLEPPEPEKK
jgi:signal peptidase I